VSQYGCNHNSLHDSCKFYRFPANKRTKWAEILRYYLCMLFCKVIFDYRRLTVSQMMCIDACTKLTIFHTKNRYMYNIEIFLYNWHAVLVSYHTHIYDCSVLVSEINLNSLLYRPEGLHQVTVLSSCSEYTFLTGSGFYPPNLDTKLGTLLPPFPSEAGLLESS